MKRDSSRALNHCFSLLSSVLLVQSNQKTTQTIPFFSSPKSNQAPSSTPLRETIRHMGWFGFFLVKRKKKSEFLISLSPSLRPHSSERLPSSFHYKAKSDLNNQLDFFPLQKETFFLINFHLSTHSHTCLPQTCVCKCVCVSTHVCADSCHMNKNRWQTDK